MSTYNLSDHIKYGKYFTLQTNKTQPTDSGGSGTLCAQGEFITCTHVSLVLVAVTVYGRPPLSMYWL